MNDLISRQAAIDALREIEFSHYMEFGEYIGEDTREVRLILAEKAQDTIEQLPPAEPKRGKWILDRSGAYCCSECMEPCAGYVMMKPRDKYCKMCGSRNEVTT